VVEIKQKKHPQFRRDKNDLHLTLEITLKDALLGFTTIVDHLDDHEVEVTETQVVSPGQVRKITGEGMPVHNFPSDRGTFCILCMMLRFDGHLIACNAAVAVFFRGHRRSVHNL
jgi:DnaJ-class molecular chaperone